MLNRKALDTLSIFSYCLREVYQKFIESVIFLDDAITHDEYFLHVCLSCSFKLKGVISNCSHYSKLFSCELYCASIVLKIYLNSF